MRFKKLSALLLAAALLLSACGGPASAETEPSLVTYDHPAGISITMPEGFTRIEMEGILAGYSNSAGAVNVVFEEMLFEEIISYGYDPAEISLEDYARVTGERIGVEAEPQTDELGGVYFRHDQEADGYQMTYVEYMHRGEAAFWVATFMCLTEQAEELAPEFARWNASIVLPAEGVTTFTPPTEPREELEKAEKDKLLKTLNRSTGIDWLGRSFVSAELTDEELLNLSLWLSGGVYSGFASVSGEELRRYHAGIYLGREDFPLADLYCVCGEQVGDYSEDRDEMEWIGDHDHRDHYCDAMTFLKDAWREGDNYYLALHKLFPDTPENASGSSVSYYPTLQDALDQTNALFQASDEEELDQQISTLDASAIPLYTLHYVKRDNGDFILMSYTIG